MPAGAAVERFARVVKEHLERFGQRDELDVVWTTERPPPEALGQRAQLICDESVWAPWWWAPSMEAAAAG